MSELKAYTFRRRTTDLNGLNGKMTFQSTGFLDALQQASNYWFAGDRVVDFQPSPNGVVTLLSEDPNGNVIGTLMNDND